MTTLKIIILLLVQNFVSKVNEAVFYQEGFFYTYSIRFIIIHDESSTYVQLDNLHIMLIQQKCIFEGLQTNNLPTISTKSYNRIIPSKGISHLKVAIAITLFFHLLPNRTFEMKISLVDIILGGNFKETCVIANTTYDLEIATFNLRSEPLLL